MDNNYQQFHHQKSDFWQNHIDQCQQSPMSQLINLALLTSGYWKRRTRKKPDKNNQIYLLIVPDTLNNQLETGLI